MDESFEQPVLRKDLDAAIAVVQVNTKNHMHHLVNGLMTGAIALVIAFLVAGVVGVLTVLIIGRIG